MALSAGLVSVDSVGAETRRAWSIEELRVLAAIYFNSDFSVGDDARDECRAIADCFGRTPASIDRQWRNLDAVVKGKTAFNVGALVKQAAHDYLTQPAGSKALAISICRAHAWELESLIQGETLTSKHRPDRFESGNEMHEEFRNLLDHLQYKEFSSGSRGFYCQGKVKLADGSRYQSQVTAVLIGSKQDPTLNVTADAADVSYAIHPLVGDMESKEFKTGRVGFFTNGKIQVGTDRFQVMCQAVKISGG